MAIELVTGRAGQAHVSSNDVANLLKGIAGTGSYILGDKLPKISMSTANLCSISAADLLVSGRHVLLTGTNTVNITSGGQATYRIDYVCVRYKRDVALNIETAELVVAKGIPASNKSAAQPPNMQLTPEINATSQQVDVPVIKIDVDSLQPTAQWIIEPISSLATLSKKPYYKKEDWSGGTVILSCANHVGCLHIVNCKIGGGSWDKNQGSVGFVPAQYAPKDEVTAAVVTANGGNTTGSITVRTNGQITLNNNGSGGSADGRWGTLTWVY